MSGCKVPDQCILYQALIDFEGWRRWKSVDARDKGIQEAKKAVHSHSVANAKNVADKLRLPKKASRSALSDEERSVSTLSPGPVASPLSADTDDATPKPRPSLDSAASDVQHVILPSVSVTSPDTDTLGMPHRVLSESSPLAEPPMNATEPSPIFPGRTQTASPQAEFDFPPSAKSSDKPLPPLPGN
jgi:hypothetical protein